MNNVALLGLLLFCLNYVLYYVAAGQVTTGLVALVFSSTILFNILFGALFLKSPVRLSVLAGGPARYSHHGQVRHGGYRTTG